MAGGIHGFGKVGEIKKKIGNIKISLPNAKIHPKTINFHRFLIFSYFVFFIY